MKLSNAELTEAFSDLVACDLSRLFVLTIGLYLQPADMK